MDLKGVELPEREHHLPMVAADDLNPAGTETATRTRTSRMSAPGIEAPVRATLVGWSDDLKERS